MKRVGDPRNWVAVFNAILSKQIDVGSTGSLGASLADTVLVDAEELAPHISNWSAGPKIDGIEITCETAASITGASPQFISAAVSEGVIDGTLGVRKSSLSLTSVLTFQRSFVLPDELRIRTGENSKSVGVQLRKAGYAPAMTIYRVRVWRRPDIDRFLQGHACHTAE